MRARPAILALVVLLAGCGDDAEPAATGTSTTTATTAAPTTTTTAATTSTPTTVAPPSAPQPTPRAAVDALLTAWRAGSRDLALAVAEVAAVDALFAVPAEEPDDRGCNEPPPGSPTACVFRLTSGELQLRTAEVAGGFVVDFAILSPA